MGAGSHGGLLHDIGHFALSDRVAERGRTLTDEDWVAIHRHPELGADMLRDLGMYGPVAEIVLSHHAREEATGIRITFVLQAYFEQQFLAKCNCLILWHFTYQQWGLNHILYHGHVWEQIEVLEDHP